MKAQLISVNNETDPYPVAPIGAAYVADALKKKGHEARILDLCFVDDDYRAVTDALQKFMPEIIGISVRNIDNLTYNKPVFYLPRIRNIINFIKKESPAAVIVGGSGFSLFPQEILEYLRLEMGIVGEGESPFSLLMDAFENGKDFHGTPNFCYLHNGSYKMNPKQFSPSYDTPDRSLLNNGKYLELGGMANIQSKRGCPFQCIYCTYPHIDGSSMRLREPADIVEELEGMKAAYGIDYVFFVDDIFNFPAEHALAICEEIIKSGLKIDWTCFSTPLGMSQELASLMKQAGCKGVEFGSDAGAEKTLKSFGKSFTADDIAHASEYCKNTGLPHAHYIIAGGPEEDEETLSETFALFDRIQPTALIVLIGLRVYPGTELHRRAIRENRISEDMNLLEPTFYLTASLSADRILQKVEEHARLMGNWIVPSLNIRCDSNVLKTLRRLGKRGPLWDLL